MKKISSCLLTSALSAALAFGCGTEVTPDPSTGEDTEVDDENNNQEETVSQACTKMDIVFVVDDSGSMEEEQTNLGVNFPQFFDVIDNYRNEDGAPLDYRIAVTTTGRDVDYVVKSPALPGFPSTEFPMSESGDNGAFRQGCGMTRPWIETGDTDVKNTFSCLAQVGTSGPGIEMPLYALELGLSERMVDGTNDGFLREDALLAVVILTDEDDCSRTDNGFEMGIDDDGCGEGSVLPTTHSLNFLDQVTGGRGRWASAVIAGPSSCESSFGSATEASRLMDFTSQVGTNGIFSSICEGDLAGALEDALYTFDAACNAFPPVD